MAYGRKYFQIEKLLFGIIVYIYQNIRALAEFNVGTIVISKFNQENFLPCELKEIYFEAHLDDSPLNERSKFVILNEKISIIECTDGYVVSTDKDFFYTYQKLTADFLEKLGKHKVKLSDLSNDETDIFRNLYHHNVCKLSEKAATQSVRRIKWPNGFLANIDICKLGWFSCIPLMLEIDVSMRCNQKCIHCYQNSSSDMLNLKNSKKQIISWCKEAGKIGISTIRFLGGEPFMFPGFLKICEEAKSAGIKNLQVSTNGTYISKKNIDSIKGVFKNVQISLHSYEQKEHDSITRLKGSFEKAINAIRVLLENDIDVTANFVLIKRNITQVERFADFVFGLGANVRFLAVFNEGRAKELGTISSNVLYKTSKLVSNLKEKYKGKMRVDCAGLPPVENEISESATFYGCPAGRNILKVSTHYDEFYICTRVKGEKYKKNSTSILDIWFNEFFSKYRVPQNCECDFNKICGGPCFLERNNDD